MQLDTNGSGGLGTGGSGNGIIQLWRNNELIIDYSGLNIVTGNPNVAMGRILLAAGPSGPWQGSATAFYIDRLQVADSATLLDSMPSIAIRR